MPLSGLVAAKPVEMRARKFFGACDGTLAGIVVVKIEIINTIDAQGWSELGTVVVEDHGPAEGQSQNDCATCDGTG